MPDASRERLVRVAIASTLAVGLANLVAELGVYGGVIVPRFGAARVPLFWWAIMYAPVFVACVGVARLITTRREVIGAALSAGVVTLIVKLVLVATQMPGHTKVVEDALRSSVILLARMTVGYAALFAVLVAVVSRVRGASRHPEG